MHLSILSDCFTEPTRQPAESFRAHRDGLLRGLMVVGVAGLLVGLVLLGSLVPSAADIAPHSKAVSSGSAVNLMHREVTHH